ncbi:hypothetical protein CJF31_00009008 [Rutstroemia sp. NJR-2017a BVV2]|nr:hypothetical protein CJF31_00009008 [Rutstroemia sp. NJR-2017a BVV2]
MGRGMCKNLVEKGQLEKPLIIFNRTTKRAEELSSALPSGKSTVSSSIADLVAKSDIIFTCVGDDAAINETIDAALKDGPSGKLFVDCSTVHPDTTTALEKKVVAAGSEFVACPVFGAPAMADSGMLVCVLAGPKESVEKVKPYTKGVIGRANIDFVDLARKDARHAMALAEAAGTRLKDVEVADAHLAQVKEHKGAAGDIAAIYGAVRKEAGLKFEN